MAAIAAHHRSMRVNPRNGMSSRQIDVLSKYQPGFDISVSYQRVGFHYRGCLCRERLKAHGWGFRGLEEDLR
jgi:hypothetical protein